MKSNASAKPPAIAASALITTAASKTTMHITATSMSHASARVPTEASSKSNVTFSGV